MGKWVWQFLVESNALWARVIRARHGGLEWDIEGFRIEGNRSRRAGWWQSVVGLTRGEVGKGLRDQLGLELGDEDKLQFWHHVWAGEVSLKVAFPRLFRLSLNQGGSVKSMGFWDNGDWKWNLEWSRPLLDREKEVVRRLIVILNSVSLKAGIEDAWRWKAGVSGMYTTKSAYLTFSSNSLHRTNDGRERVMKILWKAPAPFKALITIWRVLKGKLATCDNLAKRNVVFPAEEARCIACKDQMETTNHLFFSCSEVKEIWWRILCWLGVQSVLQNNAEEHFVMFINLGSKADRRFLLAIWIAAVWCIWKWRNDCKFDNLDWDREKIFSEIKSRVWGWKLAYNISSPSADFRSWFVSTQLLSCIS